MSARRVQPDDRRTTAAVLEAIDGDRPAVFLDYDGTLTPIVERPEAATLGPQMRQSLRDLADRCPVAVVSGRDRRDVEAMVGLEGLVYAGSHGFDIAGPAGLRLEHEGGRAALSALDDAESALRRELDGIDGVAVERKRFAIAVHYRRASEDDARNVQQLVTSLGERSERLRSSGGKMITELRPRIDWHKGRAVSWLLDAIAAIDGGPLFPIFIGDDVTDEDAFTEVAARGLGIRVGPPAETAATLGVTDVPAVQRLLAAMCAALPTVERRDPPDADPG